MAKFAEKFWTPYEYVYDTQGNQIEGKTLIGKEFIAITEKDKDTYDFEEVGVMYIIEFDGGLLTEAYPEEVEKEEQERQIAVHGYNVY